MRKKYTSQKELRKDNLKQFITDKYSAKFSDFYKDFKQRLINCSHYKSRYTKEQAEGKIKQLQGVMRGDNGRTFTKQLQELIEKKI